MTYAVTAIYEKGVLRPLTHLPLPENEQVELEIRQVSKSPATAGESREDPVSVVRATAGIWRIHDDELARRIAEDEEFGLHGDDYEPL